MSQDLLSLLGYFTVSSTAILTVLGYLGKRVFETYFERKGQEFKSNLDRNLKDFEAQLKNASHKFSSLHNEQSVIIKELYRLIVQLEFSTTGYLNFKGEESKLLKDLNELKLFYYTTEIFFSDDVNERTKKILTTFIGIWADYSTHLNFGEWKYLEIEQKKEKANFSKIARDSLQNEIPLLKNQLKEELQTILGVEKR